MDDVIKPTSLGYERGRGSGVEREVLVLGHHAEISSDGAKLHKSVARTELKGG